MWAIDDAGPTARHHGPMLGLCLDGERIESGAARSYDNRTWSTGEGADRYSHDAGSKLERFDAAVARTVSHCKDHDAHGQDRTSEQKVAWYYRGRACIVSRVQGPRRVGRGPGTRQSLV